MVVMALLFCGCAAVAEDGPIVSEIQLNPTSLTEPGEIEVNITLSNATDEDMKDPVVLYDPDAQIVSDFGTNGAALLKAGESVSWEGTYEVNDSTLDSGVVSYFIKYNIYKESGQAVEETKTIQGTLTRLSAEDGITVERTISHTTARNGQDVTITYNIKNSGTTDISNLSIQEKSDINSKKKTIESLPAGKVATVKYTVTMKKKDLTSGATITYEVNDKKKTYTQDAASIAYGDSKLVATLTASAKGVPFNDKVTLTLELKNTGSVDYSNIKVSDATIGNDLFPNEKIEKGKTIKLEKEITLTQSTDYQFNISAIDSTGTETTTATGVVTVKAVDPSDVLTLSITATADRTEVFENPGLVRFTVKVTNDSNVEATKVKVTHGDSEIYTFDSIPAGETRTLTRDTSLSMAGKYRFTATALDPIENSLTFQSNEVQIAFSVPTPAPVTPTPPPDPTAEPTFSPVTVAPITDRSIGAVPKTIQSILTPILIIAGLLLVASGVLLIMSTKRRADAKRASKNAVDHLDRAKRRDYNAPAEEEAAVEEKPAEAESKDEGEKTALVLEDIDEDELELPHMKYARSVAAATKQDEEEDDYSAFGQGLYDEEMTSDLGTYDDLDQNDVMYEAPYDQELEDEEQGNAYVAEALNEESDGYTDGYVDAGDDEELTPPLAYDDELGYDGLDYDDPYQSGYDQTELSDSDFDDDEPNDGDYDDYDDDGFADQGDEADDIQDSPDDEDQPSRAAGRRSRQSRSQKLDM